MKKRVSAALAAATIGLAAAPGPAAAATEVGNDCQGGFVAAGYTIHQFAKASGGLPLTVPRSGVVTRWRVNASPALTATQILHLGVFRTAAGSGAFETVAESTDEIVIPGGANSFETRIPVAVGDRFGTYGKEPYGPVICATGNPGDELAVVKKPTPAGTTNTFEPAPNNLVAVVATIEPDSDRDGYGDETQDRCPNAAALQDGCPAVKLDVAGLVKRTSVVILAATSVDAPVTVTGSVKSIRLRARPKLVKAGSIGRIALKFPQRLKTALAELPAGKSLKLRVEASAADANGESSDDALTVKLKGRG